MRHMGRVHGVSIGFLHEQFLDSHMAMSCIGTANMTADIHTKEFVDSQKWYELCRQVGIHTMETIQAGDLLSVYLSPTDLR